MRERHLERRPNAKRSAPARHALGRATLAIVGGMLLLLVVAIGVGEWLGWPFLRGPIERAIEQRTQREVTFGDDFRLSLFGGLKLSADSFAIGPPLPSAEGELPADAPDEFVRATDIELVLPYSTLTGVARGSGEPVRISLLRVAQLDAQLWRDAEGRSNWQFGDPGKTGADEATPAAFPEFDRLIVREGRVRVVDAMTKFDLTAAVSTNEGGLAGDEAAGLEIMAEGTYEGQPVRARITSSGLLPIAQAKADAPPLPVSLHVQSADTEFKFDGHAADVLHLQSLDGRFSVSGPTLAAAGEVIGVTLPNTPPYTIDGSVRKEGVVWSADVESLRAGKSSLSGEFSYDPAGDIPLLSGTLRGDRLVLDDLAPAVGAPPDKDGPKSAKAGRAGANTRNDNGVLPEREFDIPSLRAMNASVTVDLKRLDLPTDALRSIAPLQAKLTLEDGLLSIADIVAQAAGGRLRGQLALDSRKQPPLWTADFGWSGVDLAKWIALRSDSGKGADKGEGGEYITGALSGQAKLGGAGRSTAQILGSLDGTVSTWIRDGSISHLVVEATGLDVAQGVGLLVVGDKPLPLQCAVAQLKAKDGEVRTELFLLDTPDSTVFVTGSVSLASEALELMLTAKPKDFSPLTVRAPVRIEGSFADPQVRPEAKSIGLRLAAAAALAAINPLAALLPFMDPADPATRQCSDVLRRDGKPAPRKDAAPPEPVRKPLQ